MNPTPGNIPARLADRSFGGMHCPRCGEPTVVSDSRDSGEQVRRRRICLAGHRFSTFERVVGEPVIDWQI